MTEPLPSEADALIRSLREPAEVEKLARTFAEEYLTGHYRPLREDERKRYEQLVVVMLAFAGAAQREVAAVLDRPAPPQQDEQASITDSEATNLRYARGLLRKAASSGAAFVDINADVLRYLVENRRKLNDRLRWAEQRAAESRPAPAPDSGIE